MTEHAYVIEVFCAGVRAHVAFNGWHAYRTFEPGRRVAQQKINPWMFEGKNELEVSLGLFEEGATAPAPSFELKLYKVEHGKRTSDDDVMVHYRYTPDEAPPLARDALVTVFSHELSIGRAFGRWGWQDARPYMPSDRADVEALVAAFHDALARADVAAAIGMLRIKLDELSLALDIERAELGAGQAEYLATWLAAPDWRMEPLDPARLVLESTAGGRLLDVKGPGRTAPLVGHGGPIGRFEYELTVSRIGSSWQIVR